jgi:aspartate aminotransferase-like enzyme
MYETRGPLTTLPSSLVFALARSLEDDYGSPEAAAQRFHEYFVLGQRARSQMRSLGLEPVASDAVAAPNITTFALPDYSFPEQCLDSGFQIAYESQYLQSRNWGQIATMGNVTSVVLDRLFEALHRRRRLATSDSF